MAMKTVKECDFCAEQVEWTDMREDAVPKHWRIIIVIETDDLNNVEDQHRLEICDAHEGLSLATLISTALA